MHSHRKSIFIILLLITVLLLLSSCASNKPTISLYTEDGLFIVSTKPGTLPTKEDPTIMRTRNVEIYLDRLDNAEVGDVITLNLFEDAVYDIVVDAKELNNDGSYSLIGHINAEENSLVTLVVGGGQMVGNIVLPDALYQVRYAGDNVHAIHQIDQSGFPPEAEPITPN